MTPPVAGPGSHQGKPIFSVMMLKRIFQTLLLSSVLAGMPALAEDAERNPESAGTPFAGMQTGEVIPGHYIVVLQDTDVLIERLSLAVPMQGLPLVQVVIDALREGLEGTVVQVFGAALQGFTAELTKADVDLLSDHPLVGFVEQDRVIRVQGVQADAPWHLDRVDQRNPPLDRSYGWQADARNVHAYVVDTGIREDHEEFAGRIGNGADFALGRRGVGFSGDCNGHGTHVAGILGGSSYGTAKGVTLHPVRVLNCAGAGSTSTVLAGIEWVIDNHVKPAVLNASLSGERSAAMDQAAENVEAAGIVMVVAAGNDDADACASSPARSPKALTVGATDRRDTRAEYSNWGECVNLFAPGSEVLSASHLGPSASVEKNGTSMAAPGVAGIASIYLQGRPDASPVQVRQALIRNATPSVVADSRSGTDRMVFNGGSGESNDRQPEARFSHSCRALACTFDASESSDTEGPVSVDWQFGDGTGGSGAQNTHQYQKAGTFTVSLTVTDSSNQTSTVSREIAVSSIDGTPCRNCEFFEGRLEQGGFEYIEVSDGDLRDVGTITIWLQGPQGSDFDFSLQRHTRRLMLSFWRNVASATGAGSEERLSYDNKAGVYRVRVDAITGGGPFKLWVE